MENTEEKIHTAEQNGNAGTAELLRRFSGAVTPETASLIASGTGWRSESAFGYGERRPDAVCVYETDPGCLGNTDVPEFLLAACPELFSESEKEFLRAYADQEAGSMDAEAEARFGGLCRHAAENFAGGPAECVWLAHRDTVKDYYLQNEELSDEQKEQACTPYPLSRACGLLADCGYDGALFVFPEGQALPQD